MRNVGEPVIYFNPLPLCFQSSLTHAAHMYLLFPKLGYSLVIRQRTFFYFLPSFIQKEHTYLDMKLSSWLWMCRLLVVQW